MKNVLPLLLLALTLWSCQEVAPTQAEPELTLEAQAVPEPRVFASKEALAKQRFIVVFKSDGRALPEQAAAVLARVAARMPSEKPQTLLLQRTLFLFPLFLRQYPGDTLGHTEDQGALQGRELSGQGLHHRYGHRHAP